MVFYGSMCVFFFLKKTHTHTQLFSPTKMAPPEKWVAVLHVQVFGFEDWRAWGLSERSASGRSRKAQERQEFWETLLTHLGLFLGWAFLEASELGRRRRSYNKRKSLLTSEVIFQELQRDALKQCIAREILSLPGKFRLKEWK